MNERSFRRATRADMDWLYDMFRTTMRQYIEATWGWDELFQHHGFHDNLPPSSFTVAMVNNVDAGACSVLQKRDCLWVEMVIVAPPYQRQGLGAALIQLAQQRARASEQPLRLSVLKVNPARQFYDRLGFRATEEDRWSLKMEWSGDAPLQAQPGRNPN